MQNLKKTLMAFFDKKKQLPLLLKRPFRLIKKRKGLSEIFKSTFRLYNIYKVLLIASTFSSYTLLLYLQAYFIFIWFIYFTSTPDYTNRPQQKAEFKATILDL